MDIRRREFIKGAAAAAALTAVGLPVSAMLARQAEAANMGITWDKAPCRFCGTGCGVLVGVKNGKVVATKGDAEAPVNKGLNCIKGYFLAKIMYGEDRLTKPLLRKGDKFEEISWDEALDKIAAEMQKVIKESGPQAIGMFGSGQWTIHEGYVASKFMKAGVGSNSIDPNARFCMASAVAAFMKTFGSDEPMGNYDDLDLGDTYFLWGANMSECHPILFSRMTANRVKNPNVKIIDFATRYSRTSKEADHYVEFKPQTDLALANGIAHVIVRDKLYNEDFIKANTIFKTGKTNIGYGVEDNFSFTDKEEVIDFDTYKKMIKEYTPKKVEELSGVPAKAVEEMAKLYADPKRKVCSYWTMGFNQHVRGTWVNQLVYNIHLLTGKIAQPGQGPFSLTGQPSACGTAREVGTFAHRLPSDMVVMNPEHRKIAGKIWNVDPDSIPAKPGFHATEMLRALDRGDIKFLWVQVNNPFQAAPNVDRFRKGARKKGRFVVVSDAYPTRSTEVADLILPTAMWVEKEGMFGNAERRTQHWNKMADAPGESKEDLWQIIEVAKRMGMGKLFDFPKDKPLHQAIFEEYRQFTLGTGKDLAPYEVYKKERGVIWPYINGKSVPWRYNEKYDPLVAKGSGIQFYKAKKYDKKAAIYFRPYEPAAEPPDASYPFWLCTGRVLEHWHTGTMTARVPELHRAVPEAVCELNPEDAKKMKVKNRDKIRLTTRRGSLELLASVGERGIPGKGSVFVPFFDENKMINNLTLDAFCPISKEPDYKKCAVKVEKV
jgi:nitrate reductase NapA